MPKITYKLDQVEAGLGYSRILIIDTDKNEIERLRAILPQTFEYTIIQRETLKDEFKEEGESAINILVNKKVAESKQTGVHPGHSVYETLEILAEHAARFKMDENFIARFQQGLDFKVKIAKNTVGLLGVRVGDTFKSFSETINQLNKNDDMLEFLDNFGEFENCDKVAELIKKFKMNNANNNLPEQINNVPQPIANIRPAIPAAMPPGLVKQPLDRNPLPLAQNRNILLPPKDEKEDQVTAELTTCIYEIIFNYKPSPETIKLISKLFKEIASVDLIKCVIDNNKLMSPIMQSTELSARSKILDILGPILRGSNQVYKKDEELLVMIAEASTKLLCMSPQQIKEIHPDLFSAVPTKKENILKLIDAINAIQVNLPNFMKPCVVINEYFAR